MTPSRRPQSAIAIVRSESSAQRLAMQALLTGAAIVALATAALAQETEGVTTSHGYTNFGELKYGPDEVLDYVNPDAPKGGEFSTWALGNFDSFNRYARKGVFEVYSTIGTEALMTSTADDPYGAYCFLCTTLEWPEDKSYVIFNLRDDVTFSDGTPMTAEDVKFTHELFIEQGIPEYRALVESYYDEVEILGPHRIKYNFAEGAPERDRIFFAGGTPVFSKNWFEERNQRLDDSTTEPIMGTGPYVLGSVDFGRRVVYRYDQDYWGADLPINQGRNNFETIRIEYFTDSDAAFEAFKAGEYSFRSEDDPIKWTEGYNFGAVRSGDVVREEVVDGTVAQRLSWPFNLTRSALEDMRVREAIQMMFNFEWSNATLYQGAYKRPVSFWSNTDLAAEGPPSEEEIALLRPLVEDGLLPEDILTDPAVLPVEHDPATSSPSRRIRREASRLLDEAGWELGEDGLRRNAAGEVLEITHVQYNPMWDKLILPFLDNLQSIGIRGDLDRVDTAQYVRRRETGDFDMVSHGFQMTFEPSVALEQWFGSETAGESSRNLMRLRNEAVDRLIPHAASADNLDDLRTATHALDRVLRYLRFDVPIYYNPQNWLAYYDELKHPEDLPPLLVGATDFWWYDDVTAETSEPAN